jgi:uncharacterized protein YegP (UPF0339 family)
MVQFHNHQNLGFERITLPLFQEIETEGLWFTVDDEVDRVFNSYTQYNYYNVIKHSLLNASMRRTMSTLEDLSATVFNTKTEQGEVKKSHILIYDLYPGGLGFSEKAYDYAQNILEEAILLVENCSCEDGCPACVGDYHLDKKLVHWGLQCMLKEAKAPEGIKKAEPTPQIEKAATAEVPAQPQKPTEPTKIVEPIGTAEVTETTVPISEAVKSREGFFEILCDTSGIFRFILKAPNGEIIAVSECYGTKQAALKGIAAIKKDAPIAKIVDERPANLKELGRGPAILEEPVFEILCDISGKVRFHLKAKNGRIIAASESYCTKQAAEKGIASIKKNATNARIVDHTTLA